MTRLVTAVIVLSVLLAGCAPSQPAPPPTITFTKAPPFEQGSSERTYDIEGHAEGAKADERIVLYARAGVWWVQPTTAEPLTRVAEDGRWRNKTHPGVAYAALLVRPGFKPPPQMDSLPEVGESVLAVAKSEGNIIAEVSPHLLHFSGYDWAVRSSGSSPGGTYNRYDPSNAWTDDQQHLHMRINGPPNHLTSSEIMLNRSLGYGTYRFIVRDISGLDPSAVFSMMTCDDAGPWREMDIEISQWGQPGSRNGQFVIQPYYIPANTFRFAAPAGKATFMLHWSPERAEFKTLAGTVLSPDAKASIDHVFTAAVPPSGDERVHLNLYVFENELSHSMRGAEVVVESFEFLP
ncbi:MAG TPA: hypothetical protein VKB79_07710 [Bryobacteraceae bacterium]|nr:hypothetical protein [Bryobacteraceae bacterium]